MNIIAQTTQMGVNKAVDNALALPAGTKKVLATLEILRNYNADKAQGLDALVEEGLKFTSKPGLFHMKEDLLLENSLRHFNGGRMAEARKNLSLAEEITKDISPKNESQRARIIALNILLGNSKNALRLLDKGPSASRGGSNILALLEFARTYVLLKNKSKATSLLRDAGNLISTTNIDPAETVHILCQLIIQSVRLNQYKSLEEYYDQLKQYPSYRKEQEFVLAEGLYFEHRAQTASAMRSYKGLAGSFKTGNENEITLEGVVRLASLYSLFRKADSSKMYFDLARKTLNKSLLMQPVGMVYADLYQAHVLRFSLKPGLDALLARSAVKDSSYRAALSALIKENTLKLELQNRDQKIKLLQQEKLLAELKANRQQQRNWLMILSLILVLSVAFIFVYIFYQRRKRTLLLFKTEKERTASRHRNEMSKLLANTQEQERSKIAEKLHDEIGSMLAVVRLNLSLPENNEDAVLPRTQLNTATKVLNDVADTVRQMSHELMPVLIQKMGLKKAIEQLVEDINSAGRLRIESIIVGMEEEHASYGYEFKVNIYRIIQELFHNIIKHSKATSVLFQLVQHPSELNILIEDNGVGMEKKDSMGQGMNLITARVNNYHGEIQVESNAKTGTMVVIDIPFQTSLTSA